MQYPRELKIRPNAFYVEILGFTEVDKPPLLQPRGGAWFRLDDIELHAGVDPDFSPAGKAHPGLAWHDIDELVSRVASPAQNLAGPRRYEHKLTTQTTSHPARRSRF